MKLHIDIGDGANIKAVLSAVEAAGSTVTAFEHEGVIMPVVNATYVPNEPEVESEPWRDHPFALFGYVKDGAWHFTVSSYYGVLASPSYLGGRRSIRAYDHAHYTEWQRNPALVPSNAMTWDVRNAPVEHPFPIKGEGWAYIWEEPGTTTPMLRVYRIADGRVLFITKIHARNVDQADWDGIERRGYNLEAAYRAEEVAS